MAGEPEFTRIATNGLHGVVTGFQVTTDGLVYEGGKLPHPSEVPTIEGLEDHIELAQASAGVSETLSPDPDSGKGAATLAGKFKVRK